MFHRSVRASRGERTRPLPGDELIPEPFASLTHAITIRRPRRDVWPWLVQMGAGTRAGWYSYDFIDKIGGVHGGSVTVSPTATTTYTLSATNQYGRTTAKVTVTVH